MSRFFDGQAGTHSVTFAPGNAPPDQGPITMAALVRFHASSSGALGFIFTGKNAGSSDVWTIVQFDFDVFLANDFTAGAGPLTAGDWYWVVATKAAGSSVPRWHFKNITAGSAWTHADGPGAVGDNTGPITSIIVGNSAAAGADDWRGNQVANATWASVLNDAAVEAACTLSANDLDAANPDWGVLWNQASTATPVTDFTGGGGDQTAITGTSVSADEPPGWDYTIGPTLTPWDKDLDSRWRVLGAWQDDLDVRWRVLAGWTDDVDFRWRVLGIWNGDLDLRWRVRAAWTDDLALEWNVLADTTWFKDLDARWRVLGTWQRDLDLRWRIADSEPLPADVIAVLFPMVVVARLSNAE